MMYDVDPKANDGASLVAQMQVIGRSFEGKVYVCHVDSWDLLICYQVEILLSFLLFRCDTPLKLVFMFCSPWQIRLNLFGQRNVSL